MTSNEHIHGLMPKTRLEEYVIEKILGSGAFGITYLAMDTNLDRQVAIKEFLPEALAGRTSDGKVTVNSTANSKLFNDNKQDFINEAKTLAKFDHPNIVRVLRVFEANNTAYMVMGYEEGEDLHDVLARHGGKLDEATIQQWLPGVLDGLQAVHSQGVLHRDLKPENIFIRQNGTPMLIDFGAARYALGKSTNLTQVLTGGYAPPEQYVKSGDKQGPWTDIYALGAVLYQCISGQIPVDGPERQLALHEGEEDPMVAVAMIATGYSENLLAAIDQALMVQRNARPAGVPQFRELLAGKVEPQPAPEPEPSNPVRPATGTTSSGQQQKTTKSASGSGANKKILFKGVDMTIDLSR